ncbi:hypothetical protein [uncultured Winogradskyella sp.]|uniref:hypothetical protein n=1 Tax=uncultured Winogradskyella sp. TaxID=395353 RepID=UPI0026216273|nr:hypothetical protein [uncultured Winogradskyella sp.]
MKNLIICLALVITSIGFGQSKSLVKQVDESVKVESVAVTVTVDSAKDIESSVKMEDIKEILKMSDTNETISFKIICNGKRMANGVKSHLSYSVEGNTDEPKKFLKSVEKIRTSAINFYNEN